MLPCRAPGFQCSQIALVEVGNSIQHHRRDGSFVFSWMNFSLWVCCDSSWLSWTYRCCNLCSRLSSQPQQELPSLNRFPAHLSFETSSAVSLSSLFALLIIWNLLLAIRIFHSSINFQMELRLPDMGWNQKRMFLSYYIEMLFVKTGYTFRHKGYTTWGKLSSHRIIQL